MLNVSLILRASLLLNDHMRRAKGERESIKEEQDRVECTG